MFISEDINRIIDYWGNTDISPGNYIFPILQYGTTPLRQYELLELFIRSINEWMEKIRLKLKIERVSTYVARHTFFNSYEKVRG